MNKGEKVALALLGVALVAVVVYNVGGGVDAVHGTDEIVGLSQNPDDANQSGPAYLVAKMPWGLGPPVTMQAPVTSQGFLGQARETPLFDTDCGCSK